MLSPRQARDAPGDLGPTVAFLAALLVLADGCRRAGLFEAVGAAMALRARGEPRRLLALVFAAAAGTTAVLSLDARVVLVTPRPRSQFIVDHAPCRVLLVWRAP